MAAAGAALSRSFKTSLSSLALCKRLLSTLPIHIHPSTPPFPSILQFSTLSSSKSAPPLLHRTGGIFYSTSRNSLFIRSFTRSPPASTEEEEEEAPPKKRNTMVNFSLSDSDSDSEESKPMSKKPIDKSKLPPPYDPFSKKPVIEEPKDPKNLQEVFHNMSHDGLLNSAVKMFDGLSKDGLTHEALELFGQIKDKGNMPDVVAHTAVIEAYADAGQGKEVLKVYLRMLACGVLPNAYTYGVLIKGLAASGDAKLLEEAKKYLMEMMGKGMRPNAQTYVAVFEGFAREGKVEEGSELLERMRGKGFKPDEKAVREVLRDKRGPVFRSIMNLLFAK